MINNIFVFIIYIYIYRKCSIFFDDFSNFFVFVNEKGNCVFIWRVKNIWLMMDNFIIEVDIINDRCLVIFYRK